jgi:hypothetical protein
MPVFEKGYRRFDGELSRSSRVFAIAFEGVRTRFRWWTWLLLILSWCVPFAIYAVLTFVFTAGRSLMGRSPIGAAAIAPTEAFSQLRDSPQAVLGMLLGDSPYALWQLMEYSAMWALVVPSMLCAGILAADRRTGALQIYFSRAVSRRDYMFAKFLTVAVFIFVVTGAPALALWVESCLFSPSSTYIVGTWYAPFSILLASCMYAYWNASIVMALSSLLKRPVLVGIFGLVVYLLLSVVGLMFSEVFHAREWRVIQPSTLLGGMTAPLFGLGLPDWFKTPWPPLLGVVLPTVLLWFSWMRVRAIEVHT